MALWTVIQISQMHGPLDRHSNLSKEWMLARNEKEIECYTFPSAGIDCVLYLMSYFESFERTYPVIE
jgi:hypothetical protein